MNVQKPPSQNPPQSNYLTEKDVRAMLADMSNRIASFLPKDVQLNTFTEAVIAAFENSKGTGIDLYGATRPSIEKCIDWAARDGLLPDGREAFFNRRWAKDGDQCVYIPMVKGVIKKLIRYSDVVKITPVCVYEGEHFRFIRGDEERIEHEVDTGSRGAFKGCYVIFTLKDGSKMREYLNVDDINKVRDLDRPKEKPGETSQQKNYRENWKPKDVWVTWYDEMAKKTVIKKLEKLVDKKEGYFEYDDDFYNQDKNQPEPETLQPPTTTQSKPKESYRSDNTDPLFNGDMECGAAESEGDMF